MCVQDIVCVCVCVRAHILIQGNKNAHDALDCRSLSGKEPLIIGLFCAKQPMKIRHPMRLHHPVGRVATAKTHRSALQCTDPHCKTLQHTAVQCNTLQRTATHCNTLQHTATHCNTLLLLYRAIHGNICCCNVQPQTLTTQSETYRNILQHTATSCYVVQHATTCCCTVQHTLTGRARAHSKDCRRTEHYCSCMYILYIYIHKYEQVYIPIVFIYVVGPGCTANTTGAPNTTPLYVHIVYIYMYIYAPIYMHIVYVYLKKPWRIANTTGAPNTTVPLCTRCLYIYIWTNVCTHCIYIYINKRKYIYTNTYIYMCVGVHVSNCRCNQHYCPCTLILLVYIHINKCTYLSYIHTYTYICGCVCVCMCDTTGALTTTSPVQTLAYIFINEYMYTYICE